MDWNDLLKLERLNDPSYVQNKHRPTYTQDIDRILFSQPFRRLANKTQVHPLYDNDHIHHRLIHSLEVATVGRSLGVEVGAWLADELRVITADQVEVVAGLVQTACMAHDIGNPPFGHSGEEAIASWFREKFICPEGILQDISEDQRHEFMAFEGNA
jgi:dGTPase